MKKVLFIFGTRPEAIKMAPVIVKMQEEEYFKPVVCSTGQHREMLDQVLALFNIEPDYDLAVMEQDQSLFRLTEKILAGLDKVLQEDQYDIILVQGDTTSALMGALAGYYKKIPVGHVEAGLRTGNKYSPYPEEINRKLIGSIADIHFAPTELYKKNLLKEGIAESSIHVTGNTVIDALLIVKEMIADSTFEDFDQFSGIDRLKKLILITGHRRENFGKGFESICAAIKALALKHDECEFVYPVHLNPNVQEPVNKVLSGIQNIHLIPPLDYRPFVFLMDKSSFILTDSGGIQEEAPSLGKPVLIMRENTERLEGVKAGNAKIVGTDIEKIVTEAEKLISDKDEYKKMSETNNPYGDGKSSEKILKALQEKN